MFLIGIGNQTKSTAFTLLADKTIGYTLVPISGHSYYTTTTGKKNEGVIGITSYGNSVISHDGISWTPSSGLYQIGNYTAWNNTPAFIGGLWATAAGTKAAYSTDGIIWAGGDVFYSGFSVRFTQLLVDNNNVLTLNAYGNNGASYYTQDGKNWTRSNLPDGLSTTGITQVTKVPGNNAGTYQLLSSDGRYFYTLDGGKSWNYTNQDLSMTFGANGYEPLFTTKNFTWTQNSTTKEIIWITDGTSWSSQGVYTDFPGFSQAVTNGGTSAVVLKSSGNSGESHPPYLIDNNILQTVSIPNQNNYTFYFSYLSLLNNKYVLTLNEIGTGDLYVTHSDSGYGWSTPTRLPRSYTGNYKAVYANGVYVIAETSGTVMISNDLINWTVSTNLSDQFSANWSILFAKDNTMFMVNSYGKISKSLDGSTWSHPVDLNSSSWYSDTFSGKLDTYQQIQVAIGGQGTDGTAEVLAPVDIYKVPAGKIATVQKVSLTNTHSTPITFDLGILQNSNTLNQANSMLWDHSLGGNATQDVSINHKLIVGEKITVLPSTVNTLDAKVYGTIEDAYIDLDLSSLGSNPVDYKQVYINYDSNSNSTFLGVTVHSKNITNYARWDDSSLSSKNVIIQGFTQYDSRLVDGIYSCNGHYDYEGSENGIHVVYLSIKLEGIQIDSSKSFTNSAAPSGSFAVY